MKKITRVKITSANKMSFACLNDLRREVLDAYIDFVVFEGGVEVPLYKFHSRHRIGEWIRSCDPACSFQNDRYGEIADRHEDGKKLSEFIRDEIMNILKGVQKSLAYMGVGHHRSEIHRYQIEDTIPYVCLRGSGGGGWSYIAKVEGNDLIVPQGSKGMYIGKGHDMIKKISATVGRRLNIQEVTE